MSQSPNYEEFATEVQQAGLVPRCFPNGHWQIVGGVVPVNCYFTCNKPCIYVNGAARGVRGHEATLTNAIRAATQGVIAGAQPTPRNHKPSHRKRTKRDAYKRSRKCHWCHKPLTFSESRRDHVVPLNQGGADTSWNMVISCEECNTRRANLVIRPEQAAQKPPAFRERLQTAFENMGFVAFAIERGESGQWCVGLNNGMSIWGCEENAMVREALKRCNCA